MNDKRKTLELIIHRKTDNWISQVVMTHFTLSNESMYTWNIQKRQNEHLYQEPPIYLQLYSNPPKKSTKQYNEKGKYSLGQKDDADTIYFKAYMKHSFSSKDLQFISLQMHRIMHNRATPRAFLLPFLKHLLHQQEKMT